jgi:hypothetical protein
MRRFVFGCGLLLTFLITGTTHAQDVTADLLGRINGLRASLGLSVYTLNGALNAAAQSQAQWMVDTGSVSHSRPDGSTPRTRAAAAGYGSSWVSENIYMGTNATVDAAWNFWMNSPIHYRGLTSSTYQEIGIGSASTTTWGSSFVLVFGNPTPAVQAVPQTGSNTNNNAAAPSQPSYVVGVDEHGNIMHEIQPGDTMGDIALIYGYTWDDLVYMRELNGLTEADIRYLEVGSIFLVPPLAGTYTPAPSDTPVPTDPPPTATRPPSQTPADVTPGTPVDVSPVTDDPTPTETLIPPAVYTPSGEVALAATPAGVTATSARTRQLIPDGTAPWLLMGVVLQTGVLIVAAIEFIRRIRR